MHGGAINFAPHILAASRGTRRARSAGRATVLLRAMHPHAHTHGSESSNCESAFVAKTREDICRHSRGHARHRAQRRFAHRVAGLWRLRTILLMDRRGGSVRGNATGRCQAVGERTMMLRGIFLLCRAPPGDVIEFLRGKHSALALIVGRPRSHAAPGNIEAAPWLHGVLSRPEAERLLQKFGCAACSSLSPHTGGSMQPGLFLVRTKDAAKGAFVLSMVVQVAEHCACAASPAAGPAHPPHARAARQRHLHRQRAALRQLCDAGGPHQGHAHALVC